MRPNSTLIAVLAALAAIALTAPRAGAAEGYEYYLSDDASSPAPSKPSLGLLLMGGGEWSPKAWRWFLDKAGNGHIVIIRASQDGADGEWVFDKVGGAASVQTLVFYDRDAAFDPEVKKILENADGVFIAGGDQSNYVRFWKDTPVAAAINAHVKAGRPVGGTSAGLAILGGAGYGAMAQEAVDSPAALADPHGPLVTLVRGFLDMPFMEHVITDTHFSERDRLGRLVAFLAQTRDGGDPEAVGLGVDEDSGLMVEADGTARFYTLNDGHAWLFRPAGAPKFAKKGALEWDAVEIIGIGPGSVLDLKTMEVRDSAFSGVARVANGQLLNAPSPPEPRWSLAIHGGSGVVTRGDLTPEIERAYRASLEAALAAGAGVLEKGGTSLDAVEATIRVLEDDPLFNAGRGAVYDAEGKNQLDAAIMDGATLQAGAVAAVSTTKNPITLARAVMEQSRHVLLAGEGADEFARLKKIEQVEPSYFRTDQRWKSFKEWRKDARAPGDPTHKYGTVGAVAMDSRGDLAAATSTGGLTGKRWGRIGDSPIIGAGTYAANGRCAVSGTGTGEYFIRENAGRQVCDRVAWKGETIAEAAAGTVEAIGMLGGDGGLIAIDGDGNVAFSMNTEGMYRGMAANDFAPSVAIYADEEIGRDED